MRAFARPARIPGAISIWPCIDAGKLFAGNAENDGRFDIARKASKIRHKSVVSRQSPFKEDKKVVSRANAVDTGRAWIRPA